jgi:ABC-type molybdate transport system permease subunit
MSIVYGLAEYDRYTGMVEWNINLPMDGVQSGNLYEFLRSAGENGWEMCGTFSAGIKGMTRALPLSAGEAKRVCEDASEEIAFIFKRAD